MGHPLPLLALLLLSWSHLASCQSGARNSGEPEIENKDALEGDVIKLQCRYDPKKLLGKQLAFYWQKKRDVIAIGSNILMAGYSLEEAEGKYDLLISSANYEKDNGNFDCKIKEVKKGDIISKAYLVTILIRPGPPKITTSSSVAKEGENFKLTCASQGGSPDPVIQWYRDNVPVQGQVTNGGSKDVYTNNVLEIKPTISDDRAFYKCVVWNRAIHLDHKLVESYPLTVHYTPRVSVGPFNPLNILKGLDAFMSCSVDANPPATKIRWYKNDRLISHELNHTVVNVVPSDSGTFVCVADNGVNDIHGKPGRGELDLSVLFAPTIQVAQEKEVVSGEPVTIPCKVNSNPTPHTIIWTKEGDSSFRQSGDILKLDRVTANDSGRYTCAATNSLKPSGSLNSFEQSSNGSTFIRVQHQPGNTEILPPTPVAVSGRPFSLTCASSPPGWPRPEYRWWREGNEKSDLSRSMNLTFPAVHVSQEGRYYCQPFNSLGKGTIGSVYLTVNEAPSITIPMPPTLVRKVIDRSYSLTCRARGKPKPSVNWFHNGELITPDTGRFRVETRESIEDANVYVMQTQLHLESLTKRSNSVAAMDSGKYTCVFDNEIGSSAKAETVLKVEHSPIVRHTYNKVAFDEGENATLQCKMSAFPEPKFEWSFGGKLIENSRRFYMSVYEDNKDDIWVGSLTIKDARSEDYGDYLCRSWNSVGDDDEKTNIKLVRKSAPDAPHQVEALEVLADSVTLRWKESFNGGYANTEFVISHAQEGHMFRNESCRNMNPCRITGLDSRTDYIFKVLAINAGGHSSFSEEVPVTTKVNLKDMPHAFDAFFDSLRNTLSFKVEATTLRLVAKIEVREATSPDWVPLTVVPIVTNYEEIHLKPSTGSFADMRIMLCLQTNDSWCGYEHLVKMDLLGNNTYLRESKGFSLEQFITIITVSTMLAICGAVLLMCCCCWRKRHNLDKKKNVIDPEDHDSTANKVNPVPFSFPQDNKVMMNGDSYAESNKLDSMVPIYATSAHARNQNGHIPQSYYLTDDPHGGNDASPSGSQETANSDLWMMKNEQMGMENVMGNDMPVSYHSLYGQTQVDPNGYPYNSYYSQEEPNYAMSPEDSMNPQQSLYAPYGYDENAVVYGTTQMGHPMDPQSIHPGDQMSLHGHNIGSPFDQEDDYGSSRTGARVIREIIV